MIHALTITSRKKKIGNSVCTKSRRFVRPVSGAPEKICFNVFITMYMLIVYSLNEINSWIKVLSRQMSFQE